MTGSVVGGLVSWSVGSGMRGRASKRARDFVDIVTADAGVAVVTRWGCGANARRVSGSRCHMVGFW